MVFGGKRVVTEEESRVRALRGNGVQQQYMSCRPNVQRQLDGETAVK